MLRAVAAVAASLVLASFCCVVLLPLLPHPASETPNVIAAQVTSELRRVILSSFVQRISSLGGRAAPIIYKLKRYCNS
jgi:hypothetical protein